MRIARLKATNFMALKAVDIRLDGTEDEIIVGGQNGQGKTSLLDAIASVIGGAKMAPDKPVRNGADQAVVTAQIDDLVIKRVFNADGRTPSIEITSSDGAKYSSPQAMLDGLLGKAGGMMLDPLQFQQMEAKKQLEVLKKLVGLDFSETDSKIAELRDERKWVKKQLDELEAANKSAEQYPDAPAEPIDTDDLMVQLRIAKGKNAEVDGILSTLALARSKMDSANARVEEMKLLLASAQDDAKKATEAADAAFKESQNVERIDTSAIESQIASAAATNEQIKANQRLAEAIKVWEAKEEKRVELNKQIDSLEDGKAKQLAAAKFPVAGLTFGEDSPLFNGIPLAQCSASERLKVSTAMALSMAGKIKVVLLRDASLLDEQSRQVVREMAQESGAQVWLEVVGENSGSTIVLEDGAVKEKLA